MLKWFSNQTIPKSKALSRMGVASDERKSMAICTYLHKRVDIAHFKELFALDGKETNISENDIARQNTIAKLLGDWGLVSQGCHRPSCFESNQDYIFQRQR